MSSARSRSLSPSTSIKSHLSDNSSDSEESSADDNRYAGLTEDELYEIWQRRNLAYFDRRQRMEGQQSASSSSSPNSSNEVAQHHSGDVSGSGGEVPPNPPAAASAQNQTSAYRDATENP